jgi:hypothetical protein
MEYLGPKSGSILLSMVVSSGLLFVCPFQLMLAGVQSSHPISVNLGVGDARREMMG